MQERDGEKKIMRWIWICESKTILFLSILALF